MYTTASYKEPFWAKSGSFIKGRDPLGIQNSSISVYATLLPGMTNLTHRIRYYGFYIWLLEQYHDLPKDNVFKKNLHSQYNYIRRAELIISFLMHIKEENQQSIIGSNYTSKYDFIIKSDKEYNIANGADINQGNDNELYWKYNSGALGQYYAGSLSALGLIEITDGGFFYRTEDKGVELANAYNTSISNKSKALLLKRIEEGKLYLKDLDDLTDFSIAHSLKATSEGDFYIKMLIEHDGRIKADGDFSFQRKETIISILSILRFDAEIDWNLLPAINYQFVLSSEDKEDEAMVGWYYYHLNELIHYTLESVFWGLLEEINKDNYSVNRFITHMADTMSDYLSQNYKIEQNDLVDDVINQLQDYDDATTIIGDVGDCVKENNTIAGMSHAIITLFQLYNNNKTKFNLIQDYAINHYLQDKNGNALQFFKNLIIQNKQLVIYDFIKKLVSETLNNHITIAYKKMGKSDRNLLKFLIEDNMLVHIETMYPNFTTPRLKTLYNFLKDLQLLTKEGSLSESGNQLLNELTTENA